MTRQVAITGIGLVTALGEGADATFDALVAGRTGIRRLSTFDPADLRTQLGAELDGFDPRAWADRRALRLMTREDQLAMAGAALAVADAGIELPGGDPTRAGLFLGGNKEVSDPDKVAEAVLSARDADGTATMERFAEKGIQQFFPLFYVEGLQDAALFHLSSAHGLKGPNCYFHGTADAGATAIGRAFRAVRRGEADIAIAGGFDAPVWWWPMARMDTLGVLSDRNDEGPAAFRPYDRRRSGSILGEGAAFVVLEPLEAARARGATPRALLSGFGGGHDAWGLLTPHPEGRGLQTAIRRALRDAGRDRVDYIATHGCATPLGDASETAALRAVFGADAERIPSSSVKPAIGHLVAAAGAANVAVAALAVQRGVLPPTLNLTDPDPRCALDHVPLEAREAPVGSAMALARGLEGQNVAVVVSRVEGAQG